MKNFIQIILCLAVICGNTISPQAKNRVKNDSGKDIVAKQILIIGLNDNIKSNYFYDEMIAEESGIKQDSLNIKYNNIITDNISSCSRYKHFLSTNTSQYSKIIERIKTEGEDEERYSDISSIKTSELQSMLNKENAEYLLVLNQHYLKWQETPYRTIFHIISYSLFDKNKKEIYRGNNYFTCVNLGDAEQIRKMSKKCSAKIAESVFKAINRD